MNLTVDAQGNILFDGQSFLWASFFQRYNASSNPVPVVAQKVPFPFQTADGKSWQGGDYIIKFPDGHVEGSSASDYNKNYVQGSVL